MDFWKRAIVIHVPASIRVFVLGFILGIVIGITGGDKPSADSSNASALFIMLAGVIYTLMIYSTSFRIACGKAKVEIITVTK
jgi:hypothetical membrane protein